jgi:hypothetical protein
MPEIFEQELPDIAMQTKCVHCLQEQYAPAVYLVSKGECSCVWCGKKSRPMTKSEYESSLLKGGE